MSRMASKSNENVAAILAKLQAIEEVYRYSSFGEVSPFVSTSEGRTLSNEILVDVVDRLFNNLPTDCLGVYKEYGGGIIKLSYTDVSMAGIGVDKSILDSALSSRILSSDVFVELRKIIDAAYYIGVNTTSSRSISYERYMGSVTTYQSNEWPSRWLTGIFKWVNRYYEGLPSTLVENLYMATANASFSSSWFSSVPDWFVGNVFCRIIFSKPNFLPSSGPPGYIEAYSNLGDVAVPVSPLSLLVEYHVDKSVVLSDFTGSSFPFAYSGVINEDAGGWFGQISDSYIRI